MFMMALRLSGIFIFSPGIENYSSTFRTSALYPPAFAEQALSCEERRIEFGNVWPKARIAPSLCKRRGWG
jgi:hypothetical protein